MWGLRGKEERSWKKKFFFEWPTKSLDKHPGMPSIEQMHPLLHNGQSWMHTQATSSGENPPPEGPLR
ncbi:hypothetical protein Hanom_Chr07g00670341 [Helianthus anomalus]